MSLCKGVEEVMKRFVFLTRVQVTYPRRCLLLEGVMAVQCLFKVAFQPLLSLMTLMGL